MEYEYESVNIPRSLREHYDCAMEVEDTIGNMREPIITEEEVKQQLKKLKIGKAPGPDKLKPELYKYMGSEQVFIQNVTKALNEILEMEEVPSQWTKSNTIMLKKKPRPQCKGLRPVAITDVSYKLFMGIMKNKVEKHLEREDKQSEFQSGATSGRRVTDNIFITSYCIEKTYINKKILFILGIDFTKAFDSIERWNLIKTLQEYKIHPKLINILAKIYSSDSTTLFLNNQEQISVDITSGIRQGCNISALMFVLVTYEIIKMIDRIGYGYKAMIIKVSSLFYMDDGLVFTESKEEMENMIDQLSNICGRYGLMLNKNKCNIMTVNTNCEEEEIRGIRVENEMKYLGVIIENKKKCFKKQKEKVLKEAERLGSQLYSVLGNCCNRMLIGKTFWKGLALPNLLYASDIMVYNKGC